ncbi:hypothetical protein TCDM_11526 [Trypanosoma cruzi Dm28c]|uniref:Uncharacterized protein n=1 Tax=Trypanosoma cruzi Dm28c TaxID=1416333 RepID=V5B956_TRYCR|nr:hypothetical protein TCDM_11526 [Trypanosoma cruzi Dm28c]
MNGCSQEALTINMAREHAATPRRSTGEKGKKGKKHKHTRKKQTTGGKSIATALALAGNSTPALTHAPSQCCQSAGEKIRPSPQHTAHMEQAITHNAREEVTHRHRLQFNPTANTQRTWSKQSPKEPQAEADPHPSMTRRLTPSGHTECTVSTIDLILRPSLKNASVSDGPSSTIEENGQRSNTVTPPATMIPSYRGNSPITPRMQTHNQHTYKNHPMFFYQKPNNPFPSLISSVTVMFDSVGHFWHLYAVLPPRYGAPAPHAQTQASKNT